MHEKLRRTLTSCIRPDGRQECVDHSTGSMLHQFHASDSDGDDPGDLEFGNVHLSQSFSQMHQHQRSAGAPQEPSPASTGGQLPTSPATDSLKGLHPHIGAQAADDASGTRHSQTSAGSRAGGHLRVGAAARRPHSTPPDRARHSQGGAANRLLSDSQYVRRNAATPPPLPAPPSWLRERLGGSSLTELYLRSSGPAHVSHTPPAQPLHAGPGPPAAPPHRRMQSQAKRATPLRDMHVNGATAAVPPGLPLAGPDSTITAGPDTAARTAQGLEAAAGCVPAPTGKAAPTPLHLELLRFAAQACNQADAMTFGSTSPWPGRMHTRVCAG